MEEEVCNTVTYDEFGRKSKSIIKCIYIYIYIYVM